MSAEVKKCPFCKGQPTPWVMENSFGNRYVNCETCNAQGPACDSDEQAITAWNRRAQPEEEGDKA